MADTKTIKGLPFLIGNTIYQEQILFVGNQNSTNTVVLIEDIWEDLITGPSTAKTNGKGYFYWEFDITNPEDDTLTTKIKLECPRPYEEVYEDLDSGNTEYAEYWAEKMKAAKENYEYKAAVQKKEIVFEGSQYVDYNTGEVVHVDKTKVTNNDLADVQNLLSLF